MAGQRYGGKQSDTTTQPAELAKSFGLEGGKPYYLGSWCRAPFEPSRFPQSLNSIGGRAHLDNFDAPAGNLWTFRFIGSNASVFSDPKMAAALLAYAKSPGAGSHRSRQQDGDLGGAGSAPQGGVNEKRCFTLACINYFADNTKGLAFLGADLSIVHDEGQAQLWQGVAHPSFRASVPGEVSLQIKANGSEKILCSDEKRRTVHLLKRSDAQLMDQETGAYIFNDAWEATPDEEPPPETIEHLLKRMG
eukprot:TRINITY_DN69143_c0_g1_i1.p1 TRINITY_DN69143_c0_g1~~TRINITY_DN69143_c0_g1_i1.p1  ORF type:complete len:248 (-),score=38.35 TRINITY_DN69143_c0_g1_i1:58-801(-)